MKTTETTGNAQYRLIVGETGNEQGHVIALNVLTLDGAYRALKREVAKYKGDGWGRIEDAQTGERLDSISNA